MTVLYLATFIAGLLLGVGVMLFGIERRVRAEEVRAKLRLWIPLVAAFAVGFGVAGYVARRSAPLAALAVALVAGVLAALLMRWIVAKSAAMVPEHDVDDERYVLQGHIARVTAAIGPSEAGVISFDSAGGRRLLKARSLDDLAVAAGTEVVIERIEGDLAYVEPWVHVERRL